MEKICAHCGACVNSNFCPDCGRSTKDALPNIDYMEGHEFEVFCAGLLRKNGFTDVQVTPGSGDQGVDILAKKQGKKYAVQCKCYTGFLGNKPVQEVYAGKTFYGCDIAVVMTNSDFTDGGKSLAQRTGVMLWNGDYVKNMMLVSNNELGFTTSVGRIGAVRHVEHGSMVHNIEKQSSWKNYLKFWTLGVFSGFVFLILIALSTTSNG